MGSDLAVVSAPEAAGDPLGRPLLAVAGSCDDQPGDNRTRAGQAHSIAPQNCIGQTTEDALG